MIGSAVGSYLFDGTVMGNCYGIYLDADMNGYLNVGKEVPSTKLEVKEDLDDVFGTEDAYKIDWDNGFNVIKVGE